MTTIADRILDELGPPIPNSKTPPDEVFSGLCAAADLLEDSGCTRSSIVAALATWLEMAPPETPTRDLIFRAIDGGVGP